MGAANLDDIAPFFRFLRDGITQLLHRWDEPLFHVYCCGDAHRGRKRVVRRLRHVDVIVGMNRRMAASGVLAIWLHRLEITSLTFMLNWVPLPVIQTCRGN